MWHLEQKGNGMNEWVPLIRWRGDDICENYFVSVNVKVQSGEIKSKGKLTSELKFHRCTYLPDQPRACVLDNSGMWATTSRHDELVCVGCGMKLSELGVKPDD